MQLVHHCVSPIALFFLIYGIRSIIRLNLRVAFQNEYSLATSGINSLRYSPKQYYL